MIDFFKKWFKPHVSLALFYTLFTTFFNLLPLLLGILLAYFGSKWNSFADFYGNGEYYLYGVSNLSSAFLVYYSYKRKLYDANSYLGIICIMGIVVLAVLYAVKASNVIDKEKVNLSFLSASSWVALIVPLFLFYHSQLIASRRSPDIVEQREGEQDTIMNSLS